MTDTTKYTDTNHLVVTRCKKGEKKAYKELYGLYSKAMFNVSLRILNNNEEAKDVLQDSFTKAFQKIASFDEKHSFGVWLKRITINSSLDVLKKRKLNFISLEDEHYMASEIIDDENADEDDEAIYDVETIRDCVLKLPDGYRTVLSLYLFEEYSHREIAEFLNISEGTSKSQYNRAKKKLIDLIKLNTISDGR
ncbi:MAG: RNA polymerase sigma factor [Crocinitomicaceae bacterium]|nr:RNA polymerase sigma factor [Crocinitomicaceae bacterium]MBK8926695.1 RNA polymerase sigma factor [Crocinitomicaceae bacterium]